MCAKIAECGVKCVKCVQMRAVCAEAALHVAATKLLVSGDVAPKGRHDAHSSV